MGKISLAGKTQEQILVDQKPKSTMLSKLTKKEWISIVSVVIVILSIGFCFGYVINLSKVDTLSNTLLKIDPLIQLENELNDKLIFASKQLDKIEDDDLYKVVMEAKGKKIESIKEQLKDIETFRSNHINSINVYYNIKKDELKKKEILYHR